MLMMRIAATPSSHTLRSGLSWNCPPEPFSTMAPASVRQHQADQAAEQAQRERLGEHETKHRAVGKSQRLQYRQLRDALAHALRHGVADHQQQREEHREQDPAHDEADVTDLLDEAQVEVLLGLGLGLVRGVLEHRVHGLADGLGLLPSAASI